MSRVRCGPAPIHAPTPRLDDNEWRIDIDVRFAEGGDDAVTASLGRTEIDEQDLVFVVIDDRGKLLPETDEVERRELTLKDGKLQVIAPMWWCRNGIRYSARPFSQGQIP